MPNRMTVNIVEITETMNTGKATRMMLAEQVYPLQLISTHTCKLLFPLLIFIVE